MNNIWHTAWAIQNNLVLKFYSQNFSTISCTTKLNWREEKNSLSLAQVSAYYSLIASIKKKKRKQLIFASRLYILPEDNFLQNRILWSQVPYSYDNFTVKSNSKRHCKILHGCMVCTLRNKGYMHSSELDTTLTFPMKFQKLSTHCIQTYRIIHSKRGSMAEWFIGS